MSTYEAISSEQILDEIVKLSIRNDLFKLKKCVEIDIDTMEQYGGEQEADVRSNFEENQNELDILGDKLLDILNRVLNVDACQPMSPIDQILLYKTTGDYLRCKWQLNKDYSTCKEATQAYLYAYGSCVWNLKPTDPYLLQMAKNYTCHLNDANNIDLAIVVLKEVIKNAKENLSDCDPNQKSLIETLLGDLDSDLCIFQIIYDDLPIVYPELVEPEEIEEPTEMEMFWLDSSDSET